MQDDAELLHHYAATRSEAAFAELVRRHLDGVYSAALRRVGGDTHLAEDVAQKVFVALACEAAVVVRHPFLSAWLYTTTRNHAANVVREERRRRTREHTAMNDPTTHNDGAATDWSRVSPLLDEAIDQLGEGDRTAIVLRYVERRGFAQIGAALRISEDAARMRVDRALDKLHAQLARRGVTSTAAALAAVLATQAVASAPAGLLASISGSALAAAGAAGGAVATASWLSSMNIPIITLAVVASLGIGSSVYQVNQTHRAEAALVALTQERDGLARRTQAEARQAEAALAALTQERDGIAKRLEAAEAEAKAVSQRTAVSGGGGPNRSPAGSAQPSNPGGRGPVSHAELQTFMDNAEYRWLQTAAMSGTLDGVFGELFKSLGLSSDQVVQFKQLLVERDQASTLAVSEELEKLPRVTRVTPEEFRQELEAAQAPANDRIKALLGDAGYAQYQQYQQTTAERGLVNQLRQALSYSPTPLTDDQARQLIPILQPGASQVRRGFGIAVSTQTGYGAGTSGVAFIGNLPLTNQFVDAAKNVLSPGQVPALQRLQAQQEAQQQMQQFMMRVLPGTK